MRGLRFFFDAVRVQPDPWTGIVVGSFILSWFLFATIIILNLFAAVIVANFDVKDTINRCFSMLASFVVFVNILTIY